MRAIISRLSASRRPHSERNLLVAERERCVTTSAASAARRSPLTATALLFFFPVAQSVKDVDWEPQWKKEKRNERSNGRNANRPSLCSFPFLCTFPEVATNRYRSHIHCGHLEEKNKRKAFLSLFFLYDRPGIVSYWAGLIRKKISERKEKRSSGRRLTAGRPLLDRFTKNFMCGTLTRPFTQVTLWPGLRATHIVLCTFLLFFFLYCWAKK